MKTVGQLIFCASLLLLLVSSLQWRWPVTKFQNLHIFQLGDQTTGVPVCFPGLPASCPAPYWPNGPFGHMTRDEEWAKYLKWSWEEWRREYERGYYD